MQFFLGEKCLSEPRRETELEVVPLHPVQALGCPLSPPDGKEAEARQGSRWLGLHSDVWTPGLAFWPTALAVRQAASLFEYIVIVMASSY